MTDTQAGNTRIVAFGNQKGGVTKSTTVVNLSAALSEMGQRVLVWDLDTNPGSTRLFGIPGEINIYGTFEVLTRNESVEDVVVRPGDLEETSLPENVHLIPSHTKMEGLEKALREQQGTFGGEPPLDLLREHLEYLQGQYDFIFLDTAPSMTRATKAAYMGAEYFVLTAIPEPLAMDSLVAAIDYIKEANTYRRAGLQLMGVVMSQIPGRPTRLAKALVSEATEVFSQGDEYWRPFETFISTSTAVPSAQRAAVSLLQYSPDHKVAHQYRALAEEFVGRFEKFEGKTITPAPRRPLTTPEVAPVKEEAANG